MDLTYRREGRQTFPQMVEAVERAVRSHGFDVVRRHDLQAALAAKGFRIQPLTVLDVAMPGGLTDVCKMHIYADGDVVWVSAVRPVSVWREADGLTEGEIADIDTSVAQLIDAACSL
ncbi:MAG: DUF302 domain-containing protein [Coriobacteriia bacterium]